MCTCVYSIYIYIDIFEICSQLNIIAKICKNVDMIYVFIYIHIVKLDGLRGLFLKGISWIYPPGARVPVGNVSSRIPYQKCENPAGDCHWVGG